MSNHSAESTDLNLAPETPIQKTIENKIPTYQPTSSDFVERLVTSMGDCV
jgi:hypothetical protein